MRQIAYNLDQVMNHFHSIKSWLSIPETEEENDRLLEFARDLKKEAKRGKDDAVDLLPLVLEHIESYEKRAYILPKAKGNEILAFLMKQHQLTQHNFPEIGSQSLISKILSGERKLTAHHIEILSIRFNVSPAIFF